MKLSLVYYGNPILRQKGARINLIDDELRQLVQDMIDTLVAHNGIGLAAPQVNKSLQLFITCVPIQQPDESWVEGPLLVFINPKIIRHAEKFDIQGEGCLSIPKVYAEIERPIGVTIEYTDLTGERKTESFEGLQARCIMHENDHINGTLHIDRMDPKERKKIEGILREIKKKYALK